MKGEELDRRIQMLEQDLAGQAGTIEQRRMKIREEIHGIKIGAKKDLDRFVDDVIRQIPNVIESAKSEDLKRYLPGFMEERFRSFADSQGEDLAKRLEKVAEEAIAFIGEDAQARKAKLEELLGGKGPEVDLTVNTLAYDVGVIALGAFGIGIMALSNVFVGGGMLLAAPILAYVFRGRADREMKKRAMEEAPQAVKEAAGKLADAFDKQIDGFGDRLVDFVRSANEEMTRSIAEVVRAAREAKNAGDDKLHDLEQVVSTAGARLAAVEDKMQTLRAALWANGSPAAA